MAWTTPRTWVPGETVTASMMNTHVRDNLNELRAAEYGSGSNVGNVGTGEDTLHTYSLPASTLSADGQCLRWETVVSVAVNGNTKTIKAHFGSTSVTVYTGGASGQSYAMTFWVWRTGATTQRLMAQYVGTNATSDSVTGTATETLSGAITVKWTGEGTSDNDIIQRASTLKFVG